MPKRAGVGNFPCMGEDGRKPPPALCAYLDGADAEEWVKRELAKIPPECAPDSATYREVHIVLHRAKERAQKKSD